MNMKKLVSYKVDEGLVDMFSIVASVKGQNLSAIIEELMRDYIVKNKAEINEAISNFWEADEKTNK